MKQPLHLLVRLYVWISAIALAMGGRLALAKPPGPGGDIPKLENPLKGVDDLESFVDTALATAKIVAIPLAALFFIWAGFLYIKAYGKPAEISKVHKIVGYTALGLFMILAAPLVASVVETTIDNLRA